MADQFCLRWNNFQTNIVNALDSLKCSEDLVDVTLTCEGKNIKAHKVILSACSPYFRNVFKENPCQHPVIILKDVSSDDILGLLSYMYQGEVYIEESKLSSFLHTAALLQVKGLTGVTQNNENIASPNVTNKLYTQLTISSKHNVGCHKETKIPALKKRRSSTSDKPSDFPPNDGYNKKVKTVESCDNHIKNNGPQTKCDNSFTENNNVDKKQDTLAVTNGKSFIQAKVPEDIPVTVKTEWIEENTSPQNLVTENDDSLPDYENSMLARSLLSGIKPTKCDTNTTSPSIKRVPNATDIHTGSRPKDTHQDYNPIAKSPSKNPTIEESTIKTEKSSPKSDNEYEPEVLLSEQQDSTESEGPYSQEQQSQALLLLAGMSSVPTLNSGASTSQAVSHQQSNHAAICGDCPHCGMKYSNQSALKYHVRLMHSDLTNRLCCYLCPRSFTMRETFKEHMWTSHGQRN
ncbi:modifier of mdg4-like [Aricia agestis]|uniref:modifier of mdg4-like n=1 Tax=Aricia agestis TaxID=91739 RepID=UPI001C203E0C|nr:modifier of mdg4-like [Aricia agestis]XP_041976517.1 modifier of mdg4-like [Aricia agestis]